MSQDLNLLRLWVGQCRPHDAVYLRGVEAHNPTQSFKLVVVVVGGGGGGGGTDKNRKSKILFFQVLSCGALTTLGLFLVEFPSVFC